MISKIAILLCVIAGSATIQAIDRKKMSEVMDMSEEEIDDVTNECKKQSDVSDENIAQLENMVDDNTFSPKQFDEFLRNLGCFISCVFEKSDIILNDAVQLDNAVRMIDRYENVTNDQRTEEIRDCLYKDFINPSLTHLLFRSTLTHLAGSHPEQFFNDCHSHLKNPIVMKKIMGQFHVKDETDKCNAALFFTICVLEHVERLDE